MAIVKDCKAEHEDYKVAIQGLNETIAFIGDATKRIKNVAKAVQLVAKAAAFAEQAIKNAAALLGQTASLTETHIGHHKGQILRAPLALTAKEGS